VRGWAWRGAAWPGTAWQGRAWRCLARQGKDLPINEARRGLARQSVARRGVARQDKARFVVSFHERDSMRIAFAKLKSVSPYSQSRPVQSIKTRDQTHDEFEQATWRERCHVDSKGIVFIPPMNFKNCIAEAAKYKSIQIPGKGKSTYTKHFEAGILCKEPLSLGVKILRAVSSSRD
jgi:hypothetical protein